MSIYGTLWTMLYPVDGDGGWIHPEDPPDQNFKTISGPGTETVPQMFVEITAQAVPEHIDYAGEAWDFLPPPVEETGEGGHFRAVYLIGPYTTKGTPQCGQEYVNPVLTLTGEEYRRLPWPELWDRIARALPAHLERGLDREEPRWFPALRILAGNTEVQIPESYGSSDG